MSKLKALTATLLLLIAFTACEDDHDDHGHATGSGTDFEHTAVTGAKADGQDAEYCGTNYPEFDIATQDPYAEERAIEPALDTVAPFEAAELAYAEMMASRPACDTLSTSTLLVSQEGESDPRWQSEEFDALYDTIQSAIDAAAHCDTIIVRPGVYQEYLRIEDKDVQIFSDTWNEDATLEDGDERIDYTAERIDLQHYYETGERIVLESHKTYLQPLARAERTILEGGGYAEGLILGSGCGNRRPMVDFVAGTTRNTVFDGFTVRLMPEQDHTIPGHGHTLQARGGSPVIRHNIIYNNGSTGVGAHASWKGTTPYTPTCESDPSLEQETFTNDDYGNENIEYRPAPLVYDNISYQNNGLGLGNNHYSNAVMMSNESFWNQVPGEEADHQSPGIGTRHGAKTYIAYNIVYENAWVGIAARQGYLQPADDCAEDVQTCKHIDERTQAVILNNIVFDNGFGDTPEENMGGIAVDGAGLPDEPIIIQGNIVYDSKVSGIAVRNEYAGEDRGYVMDDSYVTIEDNITFSNTKRGITCLGSDYGTSYCTITGNEVYWNKSGGIDFAENATGEALNNTIACNEESGLVSLYSEDISMLNNIIYFNVTSGIVDPGTNHDYNILSGNNGQDAECNEVRRAPACQNPQYSKNEPGSNDLFLDPLFTAPLSYDYTLQSTSPAIASGKDGVNRGCH